MADRPESATGADKPPDRFLLQVVRYFDGNLSAAELGEMNALLRGSAERRREFAAYATRVNLIRETVNPERHQAITVAKPARPESAPPKKSRRRRRTLLFSSVVCAAVVAVVAMIRFWPLSTPTKEEAAVVGVVESVAGNVRLVTRGGEVRSIEGRTEIRTGDTLRTEGGQSAASIVYPDSTRITLAADTSVTCTGNVQKTVQLHLGTVGASVNPQPEGRPMVMATPTAKIEVRGTEFFCHAFADRTEVSVIKGLVRVVRSSDGKAVEVAAGKQVLADESGAFIVEETPKLAGVWELNFEDGLPADMPRARFITEGLPRGSKGGVRSILSTQRGAEGYFEIASPDMWERGLFAFHPDSHLHVTYKLDRLNWVNVFVCVRSAGTDGSHVGNFLFNGPEIHTSARPGKWQTISIPLANLRLAGTTSNAVPGPDLVPYLIILSSDADRGLAIDRMWVTRGGPGVVQVKDVE